MKLISWSLGLAAVFLVASQAVAIYSGLATGAIPATGWQWVLVVALLVGYIIAVLVMGVGGLMLLFELFTRTKPTDKSY